MNVMHQMHQMHIQSRNQILISGVFKHVGRWREQLCYVSLLLSVVLFHLFWLTFLVAVSVAFL